MAWENLLVGACAFALAVNAAPVITFTDVVTLTHWTTIDCTSTVWANINESPTSTSAAVAATSTTPVALPATTTTTPAPVYTTPEIVTTTTTTPAPPPPPPTTTTTTTTPAPAPVVPMTTLVTSVAPATTAAAPPPASSSAAAADTSSSGGNFAGQVAASDANNCQGTGSACLGDVTHYDGGLGACGWDVNTKSDMQIALPFGFMGTASNSNPYCGKSVTIRNPTSGTTVQAKVGDKCMGCMGRAIDLTDALFAAVTDGKGDGRVSGIQWWFD